jgi:hypothetical protein
MGKKKINIKGVLFFLLILLLTMHSYSQELFTKELKWELNDSTTTFIFQDTTQIIEWGKKQLPFSNVYLKNISINEDRYFVLMVVGCSGLPCWSIYVFKYYSSRWKLKANTKARLEEQIEIKVDNKLEKIIFKTKSGQIGELPFETLNLCSDKTEQ